MRVRNSKKLLKKVGELVPVTTLHHNLHSPSVLSLYTIIKEVEDEANNPQSLIHRQRKLSSLKLLLIGCEKSLGEVTTLTIKFASLGTDKKSTDRLRFGFQTFQNVRMRIVLHTGAITAFLSNLNSSALERIERKLKDLIKDVKPGKRQSTVLSLGKTMGKENVDPAEVESNWDMFRMEMMTEGFSKNELDTNRAFMEARIHGLLDEDAAQSGKANVPNPDSTISPIFRTQQGFTEVEEVLAAGASSLRKAKSSPSKARQAPKLPNPPPTLPRTWPFEIFPHPESTFDDFLYGTARAIPAELRPLMAKYFSG